MRLSWSEPYLWVHLAGIAAVPIFLELCLLGLAAGESSLPAGPVVLLVAIAGIAPIAWMQWQRPFSIYSLVMLALKPSELTETQRRILTRFKLPVIKVATVIATIGALVLLGQLNRWVPLVTLQATLVPGGSLGGLLLAAVAFLLSNLFLQVPASVLPVLLTSESQLAATEPYPVTKISKDFTLIGIWVKQILPPIVPVSLPTSDSVSGSSSGLTSDHSEDHSDQAIGSGPEADITSAATTSSLPKAETPSQVVDEDVWVNSTEIESSSVTELAEEVVGSVEVVDSIVEETEATVENLTEKLSEVTTEPTPPDVPPPNVSETTVVIGPPASVSEDELPLEEDELPTDPTSQATSDLPSETTSETDEASNAKES